MATFGGIKIQICLCLILISRSLFVYGFRTPCTQLENAMNLHHRHPHLPLKNDEMQPLYALKPSATSPTSSSFPPPWLPSFLTAAAGGLLFGSDIGASSSVVRILGSSVEFGPLDSLQLGQIASSSLFGAMIASGALIVLGDNKIGRKLELQVASVLFVLGTLIQSLSPTLSLVLIGRIIYGLGIGTAMHVSPLFIAETSPDNLRGKLVSFKEAAIVLGIVLGYLGGAIFGGVDGGSWRNVFESVLPIEALMFLGALYVPESPRWLALRDRADEAVVSLQRIQGLSEDEASKQVKEMTDMSYMMKGSGTSKSNDNSLKEKMSEIFTSKINRQALIIGVGLVLFQQLSGQPSVLYFANRIFEGAGMGFEAALGVGIFKLLMTIVSANLVENPQWGRRQLLLVGNAGVTASLLGLSLFYFLGSTTADGPNQLAIITCIMAFVGSYQIGFGPVTWLVLSEVFPLRIRSAAVSIGTLANFGSNLVVAQFFEKERESLGEPLLFFQFAFIGLLATIFTYYYVFETRGLSLEQIESKLKLLVDEKKSAAE